MKASRRGREDRWLWVVVSVVMKLLGLYVLVVSPRPGAIIAVAVAMLARRGRR